MADSYSKEGYTTLPPAPKPHLERDLEKGAASTLDYGTVNEKRESDNLFRSRAERFQRRALETVVISLLVSVLTVGVFTLGACLVVLVF